MNTSYCKYFYVATNTPAAAPTNTPAGAFVPNDTFCNGDKNVSLITGPNSSGKSVYLKQVGLLVYLAHIGSFLPCTKAVIGLTDRIMTRISSFETASAAQSSFTLDLGPSVRLFFTDPSESDPNPNPFLRLASDLTSIIHINYYLID